MAFTDKSSKRFEEGAAAEDRTWEVNCSTGILESGPGPWPLDESDAVEDGFVAFEAGLEPPFDDEALWGGCFLSWGWFWPLFAAPPLSSWGCWPPASDWIVVSKFCGPWIKLEWKLDSRIRTLKKEMKKG